MYLCPNCGSNMVYDISIQNLKCNFCNNVVDIEKPPDRPLEAEQDEYATTVYVCPQCIGTIRAVGTAMTDFCPYCGASVIL